MTVKDINVPDKNVGELISRQAALDIVFDFAETPHRMYQQIRELPTIEPPMTSGYVETVADLPPVEYAPVVRCKDCKHNYGKEHCEEFNPEDIVCDCWATDGLNAYDFCSYGERSEE